MDGVTLKTHTALNSVFTILKNPRNNIHVKNRRINIMVGVATLSRYLKAIYECFF